MPVFTFVCLKCGLEKTAVAYSWETPYDCPYCHLEMEHRIKTCNFVLKGSGFHSTDYTRTGPKLRRKHADRI